VRGDVPSPLAQRLKGFVAFHPLTSQAGVAINLVVVVEYLELQGLKLYREHSCVSTQVSERASPRRWPKGYRPWLLFFGARRRRAASVFGQTRVVRAEVGVIGDAVAIPVSAAGVGRAAGLRPARLVGAEVVRIRDAVAVPVGAAVRLGAWLVGTVVIHIANPVAVPIGAASLLGQAWLLRAGVLGVGDAVAVQVPWCWTAIMLGQSRFIGAGVVGIAYPVFIGVGATIGQR
jgi:hypothetical protein